MARDRYLYEDAISPNNWVETVHGVPMRGMVTGMIRQAEKIVLDDHAALMALDLSHSKPIDIMHMLDCALPPSNKVWLEWRSAPHAQRKAQYAMQNGNPWEHFNSDRPSFSRCGVLIESFDIGFRIRCIEHFEDTHKVMEWPLGYDVVNNSEQTMAPGYLSSEWDGKAFEVSKGRKNLLDQTGLLWGYRPEMTGLYNLNRKACGFIPQYYTVMYGAMDELEAVVNVSAQQLTGLVRQTVAMLAMLRTTMETEVEPKEKGRYLIKGKTHPYYERKVARLNIPGRVRKVEAYVRKQIRDEANRIRHRLHKVSAHFRHAKEKPASDGWVRCYCPGREPGKYWHKRIEEHWRGDEELGIVERDHTVVHGHELSKENQT